MSDNLISVIIPSFNNEKYIVAAIESVLNQSYKFTEVLIIDDNSDDGTGDLLQKYADSGKIKIVFRKFTGGAGNARNEGISISSGRYIAFLDSDDLWKPHKLEKQIHYLDEYDFVCSNSDIINSENSLIREYYIDKNKKSGSIYFKDLIMENEIITSSVLLKKSLLTGNNLFPEGKNFLAEDYYLWLKLMSKGCRIYYSDETLVSYRMLEHKLNLVYNLKHIEFIELGNKFRSEYLNKNFGSEIDKSVYKGNVKGYFVTGKMYYELGEYNNSLRYFLKVLINVKGFDFSQYIYSLKFIAKILIKRRFRN